MLGVAISLPNISGHSPVDQQKVEILMFPFGGGVFATRGMTTVPLCGGCRLIAKS
jgi:hypothetical protein